MPLYEFVCSRCGANFEEILAADATPPLCPSCGASDTRRQVSAPSPLKTGAFPFKPGPAHPMASKMASGLSSCPGAGACSSGSCPGTH